MVEPEKAAKQLLLSKKREIITSLLEKIEDLQVLDQIHEYIYKCTNGFHAENQIISYLQKKHNVPISRGLATENSGSFTFQRKLHHYRLEKFYIETKNTRFAFEIDENFHSGPAHDPAKELVREFEYFKNRKENNVVLIRYGFHSRRKDQPLEKFIEQRASVILLLLQNLKDNGSFYQALKSKCEQGKRHLVCFYGYPPDNRHVSEHTIFNDKVSKENFVEIEDTVKSTREGKLRIYIFAYDIKKVNEVYGENYEYASEKSLVSSVLAGLRSSK